MKIRALFTSILICSFLFSCEEDNNDKNIVIIKTDKVSYSIDEQVKVEIINHYESVLKYYICSSYTGIPPVIWKYENNDWTGYWSPNCDGFISHCCGEFMPDIIYEDIFDLEFGKGTYKIEYSFIVEQGEGYQSFFSNEFQIK